MRIECSFDVGHISLIDSTINVQYKGKFRPITFEMYSQGLFSPTSMQPQLIFVFFQEREQSERMLKKERKYRTINLLSKLKNNLKDHAQVVPTIAISQVENIKRSKTKEIYIHGWLQ